MLGRSALKDRIEELERSLQELRDRLAEQEKKAKRHETRAQRETERRKEAVAARQEADERVHRLEDRIAQLQGDLERLSGGAPAPTPRSPRRISLGGRRLDEMLERLGSFQAGPEGALTASVQDEVPGTIEKALGDRVEAVEEAAPCLVLVDDLGLVSLAVRPPLLPQLKPVWSDRFRLRREWFVPHGRYVLILARSDLLAAGVYEDGDQVSFKGLRPRVGRRHSRGGFSQGRFERIREEQIADHIKRSREALKDLLGPLDQEHRVYLVGQRETIEALRNDVHPHATKPVDSTGAPREALEDAHEAFWTTHLRSL